MTNEAISIDLPAIYPYIRKEIGSRAFDIRNISKTVIVRVYKTGPFKAEVEAKVEPTNKYSIRAETLLDAMKAVAWYFNIERDYQQENEEYTGEYGKIIYLREQNN